MKLIKIVIIIFTLTFFNSYAKADTNLDCSKYSTKTFTGLYDSIRCKRGIEPNKRKKISKFGQLNIFKARDKDGKVISEIEKTCTELTTKNFKDMIAKFKCEKKWGY